MKQPKFLKEFTKEKSTDQRVELAHQIRGKRAEHFVEKQSQIGRKAELEKFTEEREQALAKQLELIRNLENQITEFSTSGLKKILKYFELKKLQSELVFGNKTYEELQQRQSADLTKQAEISEKSELEELPPELQEAKAMLDNFYEEQKKKWVNSGYTNNEITENFSEEHLASLSLDDYALLLRRFPSEMVAHVTRQGIRDHIGHMYHTAGQGEYADGFMKMVEDGRLRSPLGIVLIEREKEKALEKFLHLDTFKSQEEALSFLDRFTNVNRTDGGSYADKMAIHFAIDDVADCYYGSEKGNEIFIAYPAAQIASQYNFSGIFGINRGDYWNDLWVWANEERGMDLDAGIVFIPEDAKVDKNTGSRYELDANENPGKNTEYINLVKGVVDHPGFNYFAQSVMKISGKFTQRIFQGLNTPNLSPDNQKLLKQLEPFAQKLEKDFGITDERLLFTLLDYHSLESLNLKKRARNEGMEQDIIMSVDCEIERVLKEMGILFKESKDTISSKDFWESYFAQKLDNKPSKIVYYEGDDPTEALLRWKEEQVIKKKAGKNYFNQSGRNIGRSSPSATLGIDRFRSLAEKVIKDYFANKSGI